MSGKSGGVNPVWSSRPELFCKKGVLRNFAKKRLWHRCFPVNFTKFLKTPFAQNTSGRLLLWATASKTLNTRVKIKRRSKVQEKIMSCEEKIMSCQWKTFSKNYKPVRVWLWLVYKLTKNYQISDFSSRYSN